MLDLILTLQSLSVAQLLSSSNSYKTLLDNLLKFNSIVDLSDFDFISVVSLLIKVLNKALDTDI